MMTIVRALCGLVMLGVLASCAGPGPSDGGWGQADEGCTSSGGTISMANCCESADDFPNTCLVGACGCAPSNSHEVAICECPVGKCFDGTRCVSQ